MAENITFQENMPIFDFFGSKVLTICKNEVYANIFKASQSRLDL